MAIPSFYQARKAYCEAAQPPWQSHPFIRREKRIARRLSRRGNPAPRIPVAIDPLAAQWEGVSCSLRYIAIKCVRSRDHDRDRTAVHINIWISAGAGKAARERRGTPASPFLRGGTLHQVGPPAHSAWPAEPRWPPRGRGASSRSFPDDDGIRLRT